MFRAPMLRLGLLQPTPIARFGLFAPTPTALARCSSGAFAATQTDLNWWHFQTERRKKNITFAGGVPKTQKSKNSIHRVFVRKFRRGAFPNRTRQHWAVSMHGMYKIRPMRFSWPYDITSMLFNQPHAGADKVGYVVGTKGLKTAVVACNHLVFYPKQNQKVARTARWFAHDEDLACVEGDLVHIKQCRRISKYKKYYVFSILEPNVEGRERLKLGLPVVPPPLFGHPNSRRIVKLNLASQEGTKRKAAASVQEQLQDFYRYAGRVTDNSVAHLEDDGDTFDDVAKMIAPNAAQTDLSAPDYSGELPPGVAEPNVLGEHFAEAEQATTVKPAWMKQEPAEKYDFTTFSKSP